MLTSPTGSAQTSASSTPTAQAPTTSAAAAPLNELSKQFDKQTYNGYVWNYTVNSKLLGANVDTANARPGKADVTLKFQSTYIVKNNTPNRNATLSDGPTLQVFLNVPGTTGTCVVDKSPCSYVLAGGGWQQTPDVKFTQGESKNIPDAGVFAASGYAMEGKAITYKTSVDEAKVPELMVSLKDPAAWYVRFSN